MGSGGSGGTGGGLGCAKLALFVVEFFPILFEFAHHADPHFWNLGGIWVESGWKLGGSWVEAGWGRGFSFAVVGVAGNWQKRCWHKTWQRVSCCAVQTRETLSFKNMVCVLKD